MLFISERNFVRLLLNLFIVNGEFAQHRLFLHTGVSKPSIQLYLKRNNIVTTILYVTWNCQVNSFVQI